MLKYWDKKIKQCFIIMIRILIRFLVSKLLSTVNLLAKPSIAKEEVLLDKMNYISLKKVQIRDKMSILIPLIKVLLVKAMDVKWLIMKVQIVVLLKILF